MVWAIFGWFSCSCWAAVKSAAAARLGAATLLINGAALSSEPTPCFGAGLGWPLFLCKQPHLPLGILYPFAGDLVVLRLDFNTDELPAQIHAGDAGSAAAHEWI